MSSWALAFWRLPGWLLPATTCLASPEGSVWLPEPIGLCPVGSVEEGTLAMTTFDQRPAAVGVQVSQLSPRLSRVTLRFTFSALLRVPAASNPCLMHGHWLDTHSLLATFHPISPPPYRMQCRGVTSPANYLYWSPYLGFCFWGYLNQHRA